MYSGPIRPKSRPKRVRHAARPTWEEWYAACASKLLAAGDDHLAAALARIEGVAARLALICELVANPTATDIGTMAMEGGITLARWFACEAERIYAIWRESDEEREQQDLIRWIASRGDVVTVRDLAWPAPVPGTW